MDTPKKSSGIIPVRRHSGEWEYLLLRVYRYWDFPKGELEKDEDPWTGALRELQEETGITKIKKSWRKKFIETAPYLRGKVARYYLAQVESEFPIKISREHHQGKWMTYAEARSLLVERLQLVLDWAQAQILAS